MEHAQKEGRCEYAGYPRGGVILLISHEEQLRCLLEAPSALSLHNSLSCFAISLQVLHFAKPKLSPSQP